MPSGFTLNINIRYLLPDYTVVSREQTCSQGTYNGTLYQELGAGIAKYVRPS